MDAVPERYKRRSDAELVELKELKASLDDALVHITLLARTLGEMNSASPAPGKRWR